MFAARILRIADLHSRASQPSAVLQIAQHTLVRAKVNQDQTCKHANCRNNHAIVEQMQQTSISTASFVESLRSTSAVQGIVRKEIAIIPDTPVDWRAALLGDGGRVLC